MHEVCCRGEEWVPIPFWELVPWQLDYQGGANSLLSSIHRGKEFHFHFAWHYILSGSLSMLRPKGEDLWLQNLIQCSKRWLSKNSQAETAPLKRLGNFLMTSGSPTLNCSNSGILQKMSFIIHVGKLTPIAGGHFPRFT